MTKFLLFVLSCYAVSSFAKVSLPKEVSDFIERRETCDHFRGEDSDEPARKKEINEKIEKFCKNSDKDLSDLRKKHKDNQAVIKALWDFESKIE